MFVSTDITGPLSANMYAYCENNPVNANDPNGEFANCVIGAVVGGLIGGISSALKGESFWIGAAQGAVSGAIAGAGADLALATVATGGVVGVAAAVAFSFGSGFIGSIAGEETYSLLSQGKFIAVDADMKKRAMIAGAINLVATGYSGGAQCADLGASSFNQASGVSEVLHTAFGSAFTPGAPSLATDVCSIFGAVHFSTHGALCADAF